MGHRFLVSHLKPETPDVTSIYLKAADEDAEHYGWTAGQFALVKLPSGLERPWTIATSERMGTGPLFTVKRVGTASREFTSLKPGTEVLLSDAMGALVLPPEIDQEKYLFLASGIGITPMTAMIQDLLIRTLKTDAVLVCCMASEEEFVGREHFAMLEACRPDFKCHAFVKQGGLPGRLSGRLDETRLLELVPDVQSRRIYACGSTGFMRAASSWMQLLDVPAGHFLSEAFG